MMHNEISPTCYTDACSIGYNNATSMLHNIRILVSLVWWVLFTLGCEVIMSHIFCYIPGFTDTYLIRTMYAALSMCAVHHCCKGIIYR